MTRFFVRDTVRNLHPPTVEVIGQPAGTEDLDWEEETTDPFGDLPHDTIPAPVPFPEE